MKQIIRYRNDDPFSEMSRMIDRMRSMMDRVFWPEATPAGWAGGETLALNVSEDNENLIVEAPVPGISEDDINVEVRGDTLTISGEYRHEHEERDKERRWHTIERSYGKFERSIRLPVEVDTDAATAEIDNGLLVITLPKAEPQAQRRITVSARKELPAPEDRRGRGKK